VPTRSCDELRAGRASVKQSQFGQGVGIGGQGSAARAPAPEPWSGCTNKANSRVMAGTAVVLMGRARPERSRRDAHAT
jgi:hypothetical protein